MDKVKNNVIKFEVGEYNLISFYNNEQFMKLLLAQLKIGITERIRKPYGNIVCETYSTNAYGKLTFKNNETDQNYVEIKINFIKDFTNQKRIEIGKFPIVKYDNSDSLKVDIVDELARVIKELTIQFLENNAHLTSWK